MWQSRNIKSKLCLSGEADSTRSGFHHKTSTQPLHFNPPIVLISDLFLILEVQRFLQAKKAHFKYRFYKVMRLVLQKSHTKPMKRSSSISFLLFSCFPDWKYKPQD